MQPSETKSLAVQEESGAIFLLLAGISSSNVFLWCCQSFGFSHAKCDACCVVSQVGQCECSMLRAIWACGVIHQGFSSVLLHSNKKRKLLISYKHWAESLIITGQLFCKKGQQKEFGRELLTTSFIYCTFRSCEWLLRLKFYKIQCAQHRNLRDTGTNWTEA